MYTVHRTPYIYIALTFEGIPTFMWHVNSTSYMWDYDEMFLFQIRYAAIRNDSKCFESIKVSIEIGIFANYWAIYSIGSESLTRVPIDSLPFAMLFASNIDNATNRCDY